MDDLIDEKAGKAKSNDELAVRELADEVFNSPYFAVAPDDIKDALKERVLREEMKHRRGKKGIKEEKVVEAVNELARKFSAPDYAKTSPLQVRVLRVRLMHGYPNLVGQAAGDEKKGLKKKVGDSINPEMSPLEAVLVTGILLQQKVFNEDFKHPPQDWEEKLRKKQLRKWQAAERHLGRQGAGADRPVKHRLGIGHNPRKGQMIRLIIDRGSSMSPSELSSLADDSLDTLGIER